MINWNTPIWEVQGHTLASEAGKPAVEWTEYTNHYKGDSEDELKEVVWNVISDIDRIQAYVLFIYHYGDIFKRVDIC